MSSPKSAAAALRGARNRAAGKLFEGQVEAACDLYRRLGRADIAKTPEPVKQLSGMDARGQFRACYEKRAQPDFKGTLMTGRSIVFEAKHTSADRMQQSVVLPQQAAALESHAKLGALCFILAGFCDRAYFVPWEIWKSFKTRYGRLYVLETELQNEGRGVAYRRGVIDFLDELKE